QSGTNGLFLAFHRENLPNERAYIAPTFRTWNVENATLLYKASRNLPAHCTFLWQNFSNEPATVMVRIGLAEGRTRADPPGARIGFGLLTAAAARISIVPI